MSELVLRMARAEDNPALRAFLADAGLPSDDVSSSRQSVIVAVEGDALQGSVGLEVFDSAALLRSLAVRTGRRRAGLGGRLFELALDLAKEKRIEKLFLLTTSAVAFFARRGFETIDRDVAPEAVRQSRQFADLCPSSAVCMVRRV
jgi:amino-acid N-acetyltransferase